MANDAIPYPLKVPARAEGMFPTLTAEQIERVRRQGEVRSIRPGQVLLEVGDVALPFFLVTRGHVEMLLPRSSGGDVIVARHGPGQFTGEANMLSGRRALLRARAVESAEVIALDRGHLLTLMQTDAELG